MSIVTADRCYIYIRNCSIPNDVLPSTLSIMWLLTVILFILGIFVRALSIGLFVTACRRAHTRGDGVVTLAALVALVWPRGSCVCWSIAHACSLAGEIVAARAVHRPTFWPHLAAALFTLFGAALMPCLNQGEHWGIMGLCARQASARSAANVFFASRPKWVVHYAEGTILAATYVYITWAFYSNAAGSMPLLLYALLYLPVEVDSFHRSVSTKSNRDRNQE